MSKSTIGYKQVKTFLLGRFPWQPSINITPGKKFSPQIERGHRSDSNEYKTIPVSSIVTEIWGLEI